MARIAQDNKTETLLKLKVRYGIYRLMKIEFEEDNTPTYIINFKENVEQISSVLTNSSKISRYGRFTDLREAIHAYNYHLNRVIFDNRESIAVLEAVRNILNKITVERTVKGMLARMQVFKNLTASVKAEQGKQERYLEKQIKEKTSKPKKSKLAQYQPMIDDMVANEFSYDDMVEFLTLEGIAPTIVGKLLKDFKPEKVVQPKGRKPGTLTKQSNKKTVAVLKNTEVYTKDNVPVGYVWVDMGKGRGFVAPNKNTSTVSHAGKGKKDGKHREDGFIPGKFKKLSAIG